MQVFSFALISDLCPLESCDYLKCTSCSLYESPIAQWVESSKGDWRVVRSIPARGLGFFPSIPSCTLMCTSASSQRVVSSLKLLTKSKHIDIEDITRWREDLNFFFEWQNNILQRVSKILLLPRGNKIYIFKPPCNVLFII